MYVLAQNYQTLDVYTTLKIWNSFYWAFSFVGKVVTLRVRIFKAGKFKKK